ncbi:MAG: DUF58 domain-containing protein [Lachnospiraceae bacterium]|nr:DUF58 domain-containing protein [Lachnospiraceae bacterium]
MRRNRLIALVLFALSLVGISLVGGTVSYGFFFFMLLFPAVSLVYTLIVFLRFKIYQQLEGKTVVAGTATPFYYTLQNEDLFAHAGIRTRFFSDFSSIRDFADDEEIELFPHTGVRKETILVCRYRGEYDVGIESVTVTDYLRLFSLTFRNRETLKVTVMPRLVELTGVSCLDEINASPRDAARSTSEPDVLVRSYVPGDDPRSINWKITARTGEPMIRTRTGESTPQVSILMDSCRYSEDPAAFLPPENKLLETLLALTLYYVNHGVPVGVYAFDHGSVTHTLEGTESFADFYQAVSGFHFKEESVQQSLFGSVASHPEIREGSAVILLLQEWAAAAQEAADQLERSGVPVMVFVVSDREVAFPRSSPSGRTAFLRIGCEDRLQEVLT